MSEGYTPSEPLHEQLYAGCENCAIISSPAGPIIRLEAWTCFCVAKFQELDRHDRSTSTPRQTPCKLPNRTNGSLSSTCPSLTANLGLPSAEAGGMASSTDFRKVAPSIPPRPSRSTGSPIMKRISLALHAKQSHPAYRVKL